MGTGGAIRMSTCQPRFWKDISMAKTLPLKLKAIACGTELCGQMETLGRELEKHYNKIKELENSRCTD
eukprot:5966899-Alexandrium_andersonii.AAC.1